MQQAQVGRQMCQALMRVATGLMTCGAMANPDMPFNSESTRFEQRFAAFGFMQRPMPLLYEQFTSAMDVSGMILILLLLLLLISTVLLLLLLDSTLLLLLGCCFDSSE